MRATVWAALVALPLSGGTAVAAGGPAGAVAPPPSATTLALCQSCHGRDGRPADHTVPIITGQQPAYLRKQLDDYRSGARNSEIMSSIAASLSNAQIARIAADLGSAQWPAPVTTPATAPAAPAEIATCRACHHADLAGGAGATGITPRLAGQYSDYLAATMEAYADGERANDAAMAGLMQSLSAAQRQRIARYLATLR
ncbi:MAG TPA: c-type cytochrome [Stellaceae bacterium]|nr:c-type cytochrome [Stellaceae bacterium]